MGFTFTAPISNYSHTGFRTSTSECWQGTNIQSVSVMSFLNSTYAISLTLVISLFQVLIVSCLLDNKIYQLSTSDTGYHAMNLSFIST